MMKKLQFLFVMMAMCSLVVAQAPQISQAGGWFESAWVKWAPVDGAESYHVYYSGEGIADRKIDDMLIRSYGTYFRADVLGLKAGSYTLKVVPVMGGVEGVATVTDAITVMAHDRAGFAFSNGRVPGAYNADGTPKANAVVIYITQNTKNTVSMDVTGATTNPCVGLQTILDGYKKGKDTRPLIVRLVGQITDLSYMLGGDIVIENNNNASSYITLEGVGDDAVADGWGIRVKNACNIEIRNLATMNCNSSEGDNIGLQQNNEYVWVHHCDFFYGDAGGDADQAKGDGALDCKKSTRVTFSYNHFYDTGKSNLLGLSEGASDDWRITYHHNWYDHSDSRHPRVRYYSAHVYNNYYDGIAKYGVGACLGSSVFVEGNYFRNCKYPILTSMQGSDVFNTSTSANDYKNMPTFSSEDGGSIKAFNNYMTGQARFVAYGDDNYNYPSGVNSTTDFDAFVVDARDASVPATVKSAYGANVYNNFDTNASIMYAYTADSPEEAKNKVMAYAGRVNGGDFKWTFTEADDVSYVVNTVLKAALTGYQTSLVAVQGDGQGNGGSTDPTDPNDPNEPIPPIVPNDMEHNFTLSGKTSTFYAITGSTSDSKGTVNYGGLVLTQCLKMESSTNISFTTAKEGTLTLVFNGANTGTIKIDGTVYDVTSTGIITETLAAGSHTILKGSGSTFLYYMSMAIADDENGGNEPGNSSSMAENTSAQMGCFPNPVADVLTLDTRASIERIEVRNLAGMVLMQQGSGNTIDMSHLGRGIYLVVVHTDRGVVTHKVSKR